MDHPTRDETPVRLNADPFHTTSGEGNDRDSWARRIDWADQANAESQSPTTKGEQSSSEDDNALHPIESVRSAAHVTKEKTKEKLYKLQSVRAGGPSRLFNPTNVRVHFAKDVQPSERKATDEQEYIWRSRDNRKGRNSVAVPISRDKTFKQKCQAQWRETRHVLWRMLTVFAYWDMSFWSGWSYSIGSALFVVDGCIAFVKLTKPDEISETTDTYGGPLCFFIGALFYQVGAVLAYLEAVNDGSFRGSAMARFLEGHDDDSRKMVDNKIHSFISHVVPHPNRRREEKEAAKAADAVDPEAGWNTRDRLERPGSVYPTGKSPAPRRGGLDMGPAEEGTTRMYYTWRWYPSWEALRTHHIYEIGYVANAIQLFGVTLYGVTGVVNLPGILSSLEPWQEEAAFEIPQIVAALCFLIASLMFMFETQEKWWKPEFGVLGWWLGFWATIGSIGFEWIAICGTMHFDVSWGSYQGDLGTIWGSAAYLISSMLQWYEAMNKNPVAEILNEPGELKSYQV